MIKPGTLCMIRGVPQGTLGSDCNGKIVTVEGFKPNTDYYQFTPRLITKTPREATVSFGPEKFLYPFEDFDPSELDVTDKELEAQ